MNLFLALDNYMADALKRLEPHRNMYELNGYRLLSDVSAFPKPVALTLSNWYSYDDITPDLESDRFLRTLSV